MLREMFTGKSEKRAWATRRLVTAYPTPTVAECDDYYPFGELISCGGTSTTPFKFTGYERDTETNLDDANARYFASSLARFMSPDPSGLSLQNPADPQTLNLYSYVRDNPLTETDPTGLDGCSDFNCIVGVPPDGPGLDGGEGGPGLGGWLGDASMAGPPSDPTLGYIPGGCMACLPSQDRYTTFLGSDPIAATNPTKLDDVLTPNIDAGAFVEYSNSASMMGTDAWGNTPSDPCVI